MTPEALERLREKRDRCDKFRASSIDIEAHDLRALLDAYAAARAERDEALDALAAIRKRAKAYKPGRWVDGVFHPQLSDADVRDAKAETDAADAVLAKAGRR